MSDEKNKKFDLGEVELIGSIENVTPIMVGDFLSRGTEVIELQTVQVCVYRVEKLLGPNLFLVQERLAHVRCSAFNALHVRFSGFNVWRRIGGDK